jgi:hypothetical protein
VKLPDKQTLKDIAIQFIVTSIVVATFWFLWNLMP